jgi:quinol monooxygenase YgiN
MIRLRGQLRCMTDDEAAIVRAHVGTHVQLTRAEPGCLSFAIDPTEDPLIFEVMESFRDRAAFDAHQVRTRDSAWFTATRGILRDFRIEEVGD